MDQDTSYTQNFYFDLDKIFKTNAAVVIQTTGGVSESEF